MAAAKQAEDDQRRRELHQLQERHLREVKLRDDEITVLRSKVEEAAGEAERQLQQIVQELKVTMVSYRNLLSTHFGRKESARLSTKTS